MAQKGEQMKLFYLLVVDGKYEERYYDRKPADASMRDYHDAGIPSMLYLVDNKGYKQLLSSAE